MGGSESMAANCFTDTVAIPGAAVGMVVTVTPRTFPGPAITWQGYVSAPGQVTVDVCSTIWAFVEESIYDIEVNDGASAGGLLLAATVTLTAADMLNLATVPFEIVPAPGAGLVIFPFMFRYKFTFVSTPYTISNSLYAWWQDALNVFGGFAPINLNGHSSTEAQVQPMAQAVGTPAAYTDQPIVLELPAGDTITGGDGTLTVTCWYTVAAA